MADLRLNPRAGHRVIVTDHALERGQDRASIGRSEIVGDVRRALLADRLAKRKPHFCRTFRDGLPMTARARERAHPRDARFVWNAAETRA